MNEQYSAGSSNTCKRYTQPVIQAQPGPTFKMAEVPLFEDPKGKWVKWEDYERLQTLVDRMLWSMQKKAEMDLLPRAAPETNWLPIEAAPKDGSRILAYFDYNPIYRESSERWFVAVVRWTGDCGMWSMPGTGGLSPKLWQPIRYPNDPTLKQDARPVCPQCGQINGFHVESCPLRHSNGKATR